MSLDLYRFQEWIGRGSYGSVARIRRLSDDQTMVSERVEAEPGRRWRCSCSSYADDHARRPGHHTPPTRSAAAARVPRRVLTLPALSRALPPARPTRAHPLIHPPPTPTKPTTGCCVTRPATTGSTTGGVAACAGFRCGRRSTTGA